MTSSTTYSFTVQIDFDEPRKGLGRRRSFALAKAIYYALDHACESDVSGAELLNSDIGQISVTPQVAVQS